ncbi:MAG TPA: serine/threonine-protein kinase [Polyangiaceae bacterium]|jgi:serine/threonine-protein kinase
MADTLDLRRAVMKCGECAQRFGAEAVFCPFDGTKLEPSAWDPSGDPLVGKMVGGRYHVVGVLGEGGMGTVYQVKHTLLDRLFAMKVLRRDLARETDLAERFIREARATASVKHPNVVAITDFGHLETEGATLPYFVMELLTGETLAHVIKNGPIPAPTVVRIVRQIAAALGAAHDAKIVHRDLKPDNVFVCGSPAGRGEVDVRVVDFGAALILGASRVTKTGVVFGTPQYMSPEQASGQPVDHRADIYALGVIMYEMFTGRVPFVADNYMGVLTQHMFVKPTPPSQVTERARELGALEDVVLRALEKKVEHRYASMQELAAHLDRVASFGPNGELHVEPSSGVRSSSLPPPPVAPALPRKGPEPSGEDLQGAVVTRTTGRRRRAAARAWVTYGGIALGVAAVTLGLTRALRHAPAPPPPAVATSLAAAVPAPAPPPGPPPGVSPALAPSDLPAPTASARPAAGRPTRPPSSASAPPHDRPLHDQKKARPLPGDFADPWAK